MTLLEQKDEKRITLNYNKILKGEDPNSNLILKPGDTTIVP